MKKFILILVAAFAMNATTNAQIVRSTARITSERVNYDRIFFGYAPTRFGASEKIWVDGNKDVDHERWNGFDLGWTHGWKIKAIDQPLFIEGGLVATFDFATREGYNYYGSSENYSCMLMNFEIPISVTYRYQIPNTKIHIAPYLGIHFKVNALWNDDSLDSDIFEDHSWFKVEKEYEDYYSAHRFQFGMQLGVNFDISHFYLGIGWDKDFGNILKTDFDSPMVDDFTIGTSGFRARIGVTF